MTLPNSAISDPRALDEEEKSLGYRPVSLAEEEDVSDRLGKLVADPAFTENPDREFQSHVRGQFEKVYPNPKPLHDETGRMRRARAATTQLDAFKPKPDPVNARLLGSVGAGGTNENLVIVGVRGSDGEIGPPMNALKHRQTDELLRVATREPFKIDYQQLKALGLEDWAPLSPRQMQAEKSAKQQESIAKILKLLQDVGEELPKILRKRKR